MQWQEDSTKALVETHVDGVVGSIQPPFVVKPAKKQSASTSAPSTPMVPAKVNSIETMQTTSNKKKGNEEGK